MLAPMQGLTNAALRAYFIEQAAPDLVFTEFVRVHKQARKRIAKADLAEIAAHKAAVPLVVQLIGNSAEALAEAAARVQEAGCRHLNLNLGCPYGRMTTGATGGELLRDPAKLIELLTSLRQAIGGSFSVKCRAGYDDLQQIFQLLPQYE
ncbi:MAG: tRNA-dihydrouridine synthase, partial [Chloroflexi bacterium]|nr:tRNA-dihydrouridine synthase [Chloroflexota bacterium]